MTILKTSIELTLIKDFVKMLINDENLMIKIDEEKSSKLTLFKRARLVWKGTEKICEDELWVLAKWKLF